MSKKCKHPTCGKTCRRIKKKKDKLVPVPKLLILLQKEFNLWIRTRDKGLPCISCGSLNANQAGHYFPVRFSALRFNEDNVHLQCPYCNCYAYGNQAMYRIGLVKRIGVLAVEELEREAIETPVKKWDRHEVVTLIQFYKEQNKLKAA